MQVVFQPWLAQRLLRIVEDSAGDGIVRGIGLLIGLIVLAAPVRSHAAPFCVQTQALPPQCIYFDAGSCNQHARQLQGTCAVNPKEVSVSPGLGHYCLLTSSKVSLCVYADRGNCDRDAQRQQAVCVEAPRRPESPGIDPYHDIRPAMAGGVR